MNNLIKLLLISTLFLGVACNNKKAERSQKQMVLSGKIEGYSDGVLTLMDRINNNMHDTIVVKDGSFVYKRSYTEPMLIDIYAFGGGGYLTQFIAENEDLHLTGKSGDSNSFYVKGGKENAIAFEYNTKKNAIQKKCEYDRIIKSRINPNLDKKERNRLDSLKKVIGMKSDSLRKAFFVNYSDAVYCAYLAYLNSHGKNVEQIKSILSQLSPKLDNCYLVKLRQKNVQKLESYDVKLEDIISATNIDYKPVKEFKGEDYTKINYLSVFRDNSLCASHDDGTIKIISAEGKLLNSFKAKVAKKVNCVAVDGDDLIYTFNITYKDVVQKIRGRSRTYSIPDGVECNVYDRKGNELRSIQLDNLQNASGVKIIGEKLIVSDNRVNSIFIFNKEDGKLISQIDDMRSCCGMLDFTINKQNQLLVANLGAFRVQAYDLEGKKLHYFGRRGKDIDEFHGCCNPVSVASFSNGAIATIEKDPTRIKIYSKEGAKQIQGIEELVKGCVYIPVVVDSNDN
jgi:hypothetical protein